MTRPIRVKDLKAGMQVIEHDCGMIMKLTVTTDAQRVQGPAMDGWTAYATRTDGEPVQFFTSINAEHYGPHLYLILEEH